MISVDAIQEILKSKGIDARKIAENQVVYDKAFAIAYKSMPIPLRWFVGKKRVRKLLNLLKERVTDKKKVV